jgi:hypothetical protein
MNAEICRRLSCLRIAASMLCVTVCSWPLHVSTKDGSNKNNKLIEYFKRRIHAYENENKTKLTNLLNEVKEIKILCKTKN